MSFPNKDRRSAIVYRRPGSGTTVVQASAITTVEELAFAIGFLAHHRLYKMSKGGEVSVTNAIDVRDAFLMAADMFTDDVVDPLDGSALPDQISALGAGEVKNPFAFV